MSVNLSPVAGVAGQLFDNNGDPLTGGKIFTYAAGTTTNQTTYTNSSGSVPHSNPIILDAAGRVPSGEIWLTDGSEYKFVITDSSNVLIGTYDNISGINSNFVNFVNQQEIQTATAGQTVFTLTTTQYQPGTNSLSVFVDGVNQYGPGASYAYLETNSTTVTFITGLHVGAEVKFTTSQINSSSATSADQVSYTPAGVSAVTTNVQAKLRESVSVKDFGAVGDGVTDDTAAIQAAINYADATANASSGTSGILFPAGVYKVTSTLTFSRNVQVDGVGWPEIKAFHNGDIFVLTGIPSVLIFPRNQQTFSNLRFTTNVGNTPTSIIRIGTNSGLLPSFINAAPDTRIFNCIFDLITADYVIDNNRGFGLTIINCFFTSVTAIAAVKLRQSANEIPYWSYATNIYSTDFSNIYGTAIEADGGDLAVYASIIQGCTVGGVHVGINTSYLGSQPVSFWGCYLEANQNYHFKSDAGRVHTHFDGCKFVKGQSSFNNLIFASASQNTFTSCSTPNQAPTITGGNVSFDGCNYMQNNTGVVDSFITNRNVEYTATPTTPVVFNGVSGYGPRIYGNSPSIGGGGALIMCSHSGFPAAANSVTEIFLIVTKLSGTTVNAVSLGRSENGDTSTFSFAVDASGYLTVTASQAGHANYNFISQSKYPVFLPG